MVLTESVPQIRRNETGLGAPRKVAFTAARFISVKAARKVFRHASPSVSLCTHSL